MKNEKKKLIVENLSSIITTGKIKETFIKKKAVFTYHHHHRERTSCQHTDTGI